MKVLYTARATVTGGREAGHGRTSDGALDVQLRSPVGYAACFEGAIKAVARRQKLEADGVSIESRVDFGPAEERTFKIAVGLDVTLPGIDDEQAVDVVRAAHQICPYSKATRGNIDVKVQANGKPVQV